MADHAELVAELAAIERMPTGERLKQAKKKRTQQLKKYQQYEKQLDKDAGKKARRSLVPSNSGSSGGGGGGGKAGVAPSGRKSAAKNVRFVNNVILLEAAGRNDVDEVRLLLVSGVSANASNEDGLTALHQCCIDDSEEMLRLLIEFGADVNARDSELWTPLHAAATCGHVHLCKYLIDSGAKLLAVNADSNMPYDICEDETALDYIESEMAKQGVTQELIDTTRLSREATMLQDLKHLAMSNGDLEYRGRNGETPLHISAANGYLQVTEFLLDHHVSVDAQDDDTWQPVHCAACWGQLPVLEMLLENGASLDAKTRFGDTPVDVCEDGELKQRMLDMKEEIENSRVIKSRELSRKRSANIRSASVRRTSMREKKAISRMEAKEESLRLRDVSASPSRQDEEEEDGGSNPKTSLLRPTVISLGNGKKSDSKRLSNLSNNSAATESHSPRNSSVSPSSPQGSGDISGMLLRPSRLSTDSRRPTEGRRNSKYVSATHDYSSGCANGRDEVDSSARCSPDGNANKVDGIELTDLGGGSQVQSTAATLPELKRQRISQKQQQQQTSSKVSNSCNANPSRGSLVTRGCDEKADAARNGVADNSRATAHWDSTCGSNGGQQKRSLTPVAMETRGGRTGCCVIV